MFKFIVIGFLCHLSLLYAGGQDVLLSDPQGRILSEEEATRESIQLHPVLDKNCEGVDLACLQWQISGTDFLELEPSDQQTLQSVVFESFALWNSPSVQFQSNDENIFVTTESLPRPQQSEQEDAFGNPIFEGDFQISIRPPEEIQNEFEESQSLLSSRSYWIPDLETGEAKIQWSGIFLNPAYLPPPFGSCSENCIQIEGNGPLSLKAVLSFWIGNVFLGLSPSGNQDAIMYPIQEPGSGKSFDELRVEDRLWRDHIYEADAEMTQLKGRVINGLSGEFLEGAYIRAIDANIINLIEEVGAQNIRLENFIVSGGLASYEGDFKILTPPGNYILMMEDLQSEEIRPEYFDIWTRLFSERVSFLSEFYDGAGRESNQEEWESSLRGINLAAQIEAQSGAIVNDIELITNESASDRRIEAVGSTSENLSNIGIPDNSSSLTELAERDQEFLKISNGGSGCSIRAHQNRDFNWRWFLIAVALLYITRRLFRGNRFDGF